VFFVGTHKDAVATPKEHEEISNFLHEQLSVSPSWACVQPFHQGQVSTGRGLLWFFPVDNTRGKEDKVVTDLMAAIEQEIEKEDYVKRKVRVMRYGRLIALLPRKGGRVASEVSTYAESNSVGA
jgi:hypothetical protein